jgi:hypothetical protein
MSTPVDDVDTHQKTKKKGNWSSIGRIREHQKRAKKRGSQDKYKLG